MRAFKKILCPVDFSEYSKMALRYAVALAQENDATLVICHSIPDLSQTISYMDGDYFETVHEALISNAKEKLDGFVGKTDTVPTIKIIENGSPADVILQTAGRTDCNLIVMGTHGLSGHEKFFTGSVTNKVLHKATVPVLTVCRPRHHFIRENDLRPVEIKKILCALDYDSNSKNIAKLALSLGRMYQAEVTFVHSVPRAHPNDWQEQEEWVKSKLMKFVDPSQEDWCTVKFLVCCGEPAVEILRIAGEHETDLVVMGHHSKKAIEEIFLGSVAKKVVTDSICPVLVARSTGEAGAKDLILI